MKADGSYAKGDATYAKAGRGCTNAAKNLKNI